MPKLPVCDFAAKAGISSRETVHYLRKNVSDILTVTKREATGTKAMKRLRNENQTPCVYYEPGKDSIALTVPTKELQAAVRHGSREVELKGEINSNAMIKQLQWDAFGSTVLHVDFTPIKSERS